MSNRRIKGLLFLCWGFIFSILETKYFGSTLWPESLAELFCDAISMIALSVGVYFFTTHKK